MKNPFVATAVIALALMTPGTTTAQAAKPVPSSTDAQAQPEAQVAGAGDQAPEANAQSAAQTAQVCDLSGPVNELFAVRNNSSLGYLDALRTEAEARRRLLEAAVACDQREITALTEALESLADDAKTQPAYGRIVEGLANAAIFYNGQRSGISNLGPQNIKTASQAIAEWREETYAPLVALTDNFILWADNQDLLGRAGDRLTQVNRLVVSLKLVNQEEETAAKFEEAEKRLEAALAENDNARSALNQGQAAQGLEHIQASLRALADTYRVFLDLQTDLKNLLS